MTYNHPSMFITNDEYKIHKYNTELRALSDFQFVLETFLHNKTDLFYISKAIVNYRLDGISAQMTLKKSLREGFNARKSAGMSFLVIVFL